MVSHLFLADGGTWSGEDVEGLTFTIDVSALHAAITALHTNVITIDVSDDRVMLGPYYGESEPVELVSATIHESTGAVSRASIVLLPGNITSLLRDVFLFGETVDVRVVPRMAINHLVAEDDPGERPALIMHQRGDEDCPARHIQAALAELRVRS